MPEIKLQDKNQRLLFPRSLEEYISMNHPARLLSNIIETFDISGLKEVNDKGRGLYPREMLLQLLLYSYSRGITSSRDIERNCMENVAFMWITHGEIPSYRTICRFREESKELLMKCLRDHIIRLLKLNLINPRHIFIDGSKFYANASDLSVTSEDLIKHREKEIEKAVTRLLEEARKIDIEEDELFGSENSGNQLPGDIEKEVKKIEKKREKISKEKVILKRKREEEKVNKSKSKQKKINTTDETSKFMKFSNCHGKHIGYNSQLSTEEKNGFIVGGEVITARTDNRALVPLVEKTEENIQDKVEQVAADNGYWSSEEFLKLDEKVDLVIATAAPKKEKKFGSEDFTFINKRDVFVCKNNKELKYLKDQVCSGVKYRIYVASKKDCKDCKYKNQCLSKRNSLKYTGRKISFAPEVEEIRDKVKKRYNSEEGKQIYSKRQYISESAFGIIKNVMKFRKFSLRGLEKVNIEWLFVILAFNIRKEIKLMC